MSLPPLYSHQARTIEAVKRAYVAGARRIVVVMPTGAGKTRTATEIVGGAIRKGRRVVFLVRREELVDQAAASIAKLGVDFGVIKAGRPSRPTAPIQITMAQTVTARPEDRPPADILCDDETQHSVCSTQLELLRCYPDAELVLGLTATPERGDRKPLGQSSGGIYQHLVSETSVEELQNTLRPDGFPILVKCEAVGPKAYQKELWKRPLQGLIDHAFRNGKMRRTILFASSVEEAEAIAAEARSYGIRAASVDGKLDSDTRKERIKAFSGGALDLLTNIFCLAEGFDVPATEVCAIARGCAASSTFLQMVGRVLRSSPESGKSDALLIDYRGLSHVHGLVHWKREYSLEGKAISLVQKPRLQQCPTCGGVFDPTPRCPRCGSVLPKMKQAKQRVRETETINIGPDRVTPDSVKAHYFADLMRQAAIKGYKPGWAKFRFHARFSHWPSPAQMASAQVAS